MFGSNSLLSWVAEILPATTTKKASKIIMLIRFSAALVSKCIVSFLPLTSSNFWYGYGPTPIDPRRSPGFDPRFYTCKISQRFQPKIHESAGDRRPAGDPAVSAEPPTRLVVGIMHAALGPLVALAQRDLLEESCGHDGEQQAAAAEQEGFGGRDRQGRLHRPQDRIDDLVDDRGRDLLGGQAFVDRVERLGIDQRLGC